MDAIDAFLWVTSFSYFAYALLPEKPIRNQGSIQRLGMLFCGVLFASNLLLNIQQLWVPMGFAWAVAAALSYFGYVQWSPIYMEKPSEAMQCLMCLWDLTIALCCVMKA